MYIPYRTTHPRNNERYFPFLPFVTGLALGPLLVSPWLYGGGYYRPPYYPPYPYYGPTVPYRPHW
nr:hypothetical protein [Bacillus fonticola]